MFARFNSLVKWNVLFTLSDIRFTWIVAQILSRALSLSFAFHSSSSWSKTFYSSLFMFGCISTNSKQNIKKESLLPRHASQHLKGDSKGVDDDVDGGGNYDNNETFIVIKKDRKFRGIAFFFCAIVVAVSSFHSPSDGCQHGSLFIFWFCFCFAPPPPLALPLFFLFVLRKSKVLFHSVQITFKNCC